MALSWSDDFDPNSSINANKGAVWIRTVTFITQTFIKNKLDDTYKIIINLKQRSHDVVERQFTSSALSKEWGCLAQKNDI